MAAIRVFSIPELAEDIILRLHPRDILCLQRTCRVLRDTINDTPTIQTLLFLKPASPFCVFELRRSPSQSVTTPTAVTLNSSAHWGSSAAPNIQIRPIENPFLVLLDRESEAHHSPKFRHEDASWRRMLVTQPPVDRLEAYHQLASSDHRSLVWILPRNREPIEELSPPSIDLEANLVVRDGGHRLISSASDTNCGSHTDGTENCVTLGDLERRLSVNMHNIDNWCLWQPFKGWDHLSAFGGKGSYNRFDENFLELELDDDDEANWKSEPWKRFEAQLRH